MKNTTRVKGFRDKSTSETSEKVKAPPETHMKDEIPASTKRNLHKVYTFFWEKEKQRRGWL
jgi:hypothetical protein